MGRDAAFESDMTEQLRRSAERLRQLETPQAHEPTATHGAEALETLWTRQARAEQRLRRLKEADEDAWVQFLAGLETAWNERRRRLAEPPCEHAKSTGGTSPP